MTCHAIARVLRLWRGRLCMKRQPLTTPTYADRTIALSFFLLAQVVMLANAHFRIVLKLEMRWTPLHYAVMGGHERIVERLLEKAPVRRITINRKDVRSLGFRLVLSLHEDFDMQANLTVSMLP